MKGEGSDFELRKPMEWEKVPIQESDKNSLLNQKGISKKYNKYTGLSQKILPAYCKLSFIRTGINSCPNK